MEVGQLRAEVVSPILREALERLDLALESLCDLLFLPFKHILESTCLFFMDFLGSAALLVDHPSCLSHEFFTHLSVLMDLLVETLLEELYLLLEGFLDNIYLSFVISDQGFIALCNALIDLGLVYRRPCL